MLLILACPDSVLPSYAGGRITSTDAWQTVYGGRRLSFHYRVSSDNDFSGNLGWRLSLGERTLKQGEQSIIIKARQPGITTLAIDMPDVDPGKSIRVSLAVSAYDSDGRSNTDTLAKQLWVFDRQPFESRLAAVNKRAIYLFDPVGKTAKKIGAIPAVHAIREVDRIFHLEKSLIIVGQGVSISNHRGLSEALYKAASSGNGVLCIAPKNGKINLLPYSGARTDPPSKITVSDIQVVRSLDKRIGIRTWYPGGAFDIGGVSINSGPGGSFFEIRPGKWDWPWAEIDFGATHGMLVIGGFNLMEKWDDSPSAPCLLISVLEKMAGQMETPTDSSF